MDELDADLDYLFDYFLLLLVVLLCGLDGFEGLLVVKESKRFVEAPEAVAESVCGLPAERLVESLRIL